MTIEATIHNLKWGTAPGRWARKFVTWLGWLMMRASRRMFRWSLGRCSWCGANCGFDSVISRKGKRCESLRRDCREFP